MSATGLEVVDKSTTNIWLDEISDKIGPERKLAWHVLGVVLRCLREQLTVEDSAHLAAQLPLIVRGALYDQYRPAIQPDRVRSREEFVRRVGEGLSSVRRVDPQSAIQAVFSVLERHVTAGEIAKMKHALPEDVRAFWPQGALQP